MNRTPVLLAIAALATIAATARSADERQPDNLLAPVAAPVSSVPTDLAVAAADAHRRYYNDRYGRRYYLDRDGDRIYR